MKHLKLFNDTASYDTYKNSEDYVLPNVVFNEETGLVYYDTYVDPSSPNLVCVYDIVDTSRETQIMAGYASHAYTSMIVDGVEMDFDCYYQFDTTGLHTVEFIFDEEYKTVLPSQGFDYVKQLVSITIPESITSISRDAIVTINLREFKGKYASKDGKCLIVDGELILSAKEGLKGLTSYTIPNDVTHIGIWAFQNCTSLTNITIPNSVTSIGYGAFEDCSSLTSVTIPDIVTEIGAYAFEDCSSLTSVTIGNSVTSIGASAFFNCTSLTSVTIPDSVTTIGGSAFFNCSSLTSVTIPDSVTEIGSSAFQGCSNLQKFNGKFASEDGRCLIIDDVLNYFAPAGLTEYTIPDGVTEIGSSAFYGYSSLSSITIPNSVTEIGMYAFKNCSNLTSVYCKATNPPHVSYEALYENASDLKIYVPESRVYTYEQSQYWKEYEIVGYNF